MFCTKCGVENPADANFCYKCGNELYGANNSVSANENIDVDETQSTIDEPEKFTTIFGNEYTVEEDTSRDDDKSDNITPLANFWGNMLDFYGKMGRHDFWSAAVVMAALNIVILTICLLINFIPLWWLYDVAFFIATLSASVRRLHDTNRSGAYVLLNLIPLIGQVILLIMLLQKGETSSYVEPWWDGLFAMAMIILVIGAIYVGGVTYSYYQEEQERQEYQDDFDRTIDDLDDDSYDTDDY